MDAEEKKNTLGEWSDSDDDWIWDVEENTLGEWSDSDDDWVWDEEQTGRGRKRKNDEVNETSSEDEGSISSENNFYTIEQVRQTRSKKFRMAAMDYEIQFNNNERELDLIQGYERTQQIFEHLLNDVTTGMKDEDQVRFVLRSEQLDKPISLPFMPVQRLTAERIFSQIERVVQSNQDFRLNDTVIVDIVHIESPQGGKGRKRVQLNIKDFLHKKGSIITIQNKDDLCLARALVVAIAKIEKAPNYKSIVDSRRPRQEKAARELHRVANVPLGPCGIAEVQMFQKYLKHYEINVISVDHNNAFIYPNKPTTTQNVKPIYLYLHHNHYDVITSVPGFLAKVYFCHKCGQSYDHTLDHICPDMCKSCRSPDCKDVEDPRSCEQCNRWFKSETCYNKHKEPIGGGKSVCQGIKKCGKCGKSVNVISLDPEKHICGKKCTTCGVIVKEKEVHECYIQKPKKSDTEKESQYSELLFFDYECRQEDGIHKPNLCIVHNESGDEWIFQGDNTNVDFCNWLFTKDHQGCIVVAHNFQGYDGYFIQNFLNENCVKYEIILRGAKTLSMTVPMFNIKFIDSLNFIPMSLSKFPKTFGMEELCKGYFPHLFNRKENEKYEGPIPSEPYYMPNTMKPET